MESSSVQILHMPQAVQNDSLSSLEHERLTASNTSGVLRGGRVIVDLDATETGALVRAIPLSLEPDELEHLGACAIAMAANARARIAAREIKTEGEC